jgi:hypothetical protein
LSTLGGDQTEAQIARFDEFALDDPAWPQTARPSIQ